MVNRRLFDKVVNQVQRFKRGLDHGGMADAFNHRNLCPGNAFEQLCVLWWHDGIETSEDRKQGWTWFHGGKSLIRRSCSSINDALIVCFSKSAVGQSSEISHELFWNDEAWRESLRQASPDCPVVLEMRQELADNWHKIDFGHYREGCFRGGRAVDQDHAIDSLRLNLGESHRDLAAH